MDLAVSLETGKLGRTLWLCGLGLAFGAIATEALPVLVGTRWDWGFTYVTARFVLLPISCLLHIVLSVLFALAWSLRRGPVSAVPLASVLVPVAYLIAHWWFPFFWFLPAS